MAKRTLRTYGRVLCALLTLCAPARERALAQFSFPYDPDFQSKEALERPKAVPSLPTPELGEAPPPAAPERPQPPAAPATPEIPSAVAPRPEPVPMGPIPIGTADMEHGEPVIVRPGGPFLLLDRPNPSRILDRRAEAPAPEFDEFLRGLKPFAVDQERWNKMRGDAERGLLPVEEIETPVLPLPPEELFLSTGGPRPPPPEVELPGYGTSLAITGRKIIGFQFSEKRFLNDQKTSGRPKSTNLIDITQQLQLRMQGKVGPKITVNIDYDDTKPNKQDISIVYTGDPNEVVQNASFGDIDLSLPATEFVSYNKQLFGIRCDLKWKGFRGNFIGSRTKGQTKTKQFIGNTQFVAMDISDSSYIRRQYYDLTFGKPSRLPIKPGTEKVYLAQQNPLAINSNSLTTTADDLAVAESSFTGSFNQLFPGQDYTIDYVKGILTFRTTLQPQYVVAVDFVDASDNQLIKQTSTTVNGGTGLLKLIKTNADLPISQSTTTAAAELGHNRELKTFYSIGANQIVRDDGRGNFALKVLDPNTRVEVGPALNPVQKYPDTIEVDFENGLFRLLSPFGVSITTPTPDPELYAPVPIGKRLFRVEYHFRLRTFFLEPNLVLQSEVVLVDGVRLVRNVDYFIDYESGFITFFNDNRIRPDSIVDISFEVAPFAGAQAESILGTRISHEFNKHFAMGTTLLYQSGTKSPTVPTVTDLAKSLLVYDLDSQLKDVWLLRDRLKGTFQGEVARSHQNPNLSGEALIDNMEGAKQEESAGLLTSFWQIAANPTQPPGDPRSQTLANVDIPILEITPNAQANAKDSQKTLQLTYDFTINGTTETSIVYVFSPTGLDFSQKTALEVILQGDNSGNEINFSLGGIDENADGSGVLRTEDANNDGILQPAEDIGWLYDPGSPKDSRKYGGGNGRIDTADLNRNSRLDGADLTGDNFGYNAGAGTKHNELFDVTSGSTRTKLNFTGWHVLHIPLDISTVTASRWTNVKELRLSVRKAAVGADNGAIKFARIAVTGNSWQRGQAGDPSTGAGPKGGEKLDVSAVNNVDNPGYLPIYNAGGDAQGVFNDLYGSIGDLQRQASSKNLQEQALQIAWQDLAAGATVSTRRTFVRPIDISQHRKFNFLVYGNADPNNVDTTDNVFFLRVGSDRNFFEVQVPLAFQGWRKVALVQRDLTGDQIPDAWSLDQGPSGSVAFSTGTPTFQQVAQLVAGVYSSGSAAPTRGAMWLNELYLSEPIQRNGAAQKLQMDLDIPGWATFGAKYRFVDRHYMTPTTTVSNQDKRQDTAYLNFTRLAFFPMSFTFARAVTETPNTNAVGNTANLVNLLQQGKVTNWNGTANGNFALGAWPRLSLGYLRDRTDYQLLTRLDDRNTYNSALSYSVPIDNRFLPKTIDLSGSYSKYSVSFESLQMRRTPGFFNTDEFTKTMGLRLSFVPWSGSSFNPNFSLTTVDEKRSDMTRGTEEVLRYPKSSNENAGLSSNLRFLSWLNPSFNYSASTIENNVLNVSTFVITGVTHVFNVGDIKTVNRSANGSVSLPINIVDIFPRTRLFRSFNLANGYQLQDGDVWNNVEKELGTKLALWVRTPLRPAGPAAQRVNLTLRDTMNSTQRWSPLEAYNILGRRSALRTLNLTNNFVESIQRTDATGTKSKTISTTLPDIVASLGQIEKLAFADRWMSNGQINLKYAAHTTEAVAVSLDSDQSIGTDVRAIIRKRFDTALSLNWRSADKKDLRLDVVTQRTSHEDATLQTTFDVSKFRFTPKVDYAKDVTEQGTGAKTQDLMVVTPSVLARADLALPRGLLVPFTRTPILFTNRIIWTNTVSLAIRSSPLTTADNSKFLNFTTSGDYEIARNLRMTLNGAFSRLWHNFLKEDEFLSYQFGTTLTFQF